MPEKVRQSRKPFHRKLMLQSRKGFGKVGTPFTADENPSSACLVYICTNISSQPENVKKVFLWGTISYTTFSTWGRGDEGDTKLNIFTFDLFTLSINIDLRLR